jgi:hypothetical protein
MVHCRTTRFVSSGRGVTVRSCMLTCPHLSAACPHSWWVTFHVEQRLGSLTDRSAAVGTGVGAWRYFRHAVQRRCARAGSGGERRTDDTTAVFHVEQCGTSTHPAVAPEHLELLDQAALGGRPPTPGERYARHRGQRRCMCREGRGAAASVTRSQWPVSPSEGPLGLGYTRLRERS